MTIFKIRAGLYVVGNTQILRHDPIPGRQQTTTWRDVFTGKILGYTLAEAKAAVKQAMKEIKR